MFLALPGFFIFHFSLGWKGLGWFRRSLRPAIGWPKSPNVDRTKSADPWLIAFNVYGFKKAQTFMKFLAEAFLTTLPVNKANELPDVLQGIQNFWNRMWLVCAHVQATKVFMVFQVYCDPCLDPYLSEVLTGMPSKRPTCIADCTEHIILLFPYFDRAPFCHTFRNFGMLNTCWRTVNMPLRLYKNNVGKIGKSTSVDLLSLRPY